MTIITLTTVGYGDSISMPSLDFTSDHRYDWTVLSQIILIGLLIFAYIRNNLDKIIDELKQTTSYDDIIFEINEDIEKYFIIHNKI